MKSSVVLATYNGEKYIVPLLDSLQRQSRKIDELIIVDDNSQDKTVSIVKKYIIDNKLALWKLYENPYNLGWKKNFKVALSHATGDIVFLCDQDDIWHLNKVEYMMEAFEENRQIGLLVSDFHVLCEKKNIRSNMEPIWTHGNQRIDRVRFEKNYYDIKRPGCVMAANKNVIELFLQEWNENWAHDASLWTIANLMGNLFYIRENLVEYRRHENNVTNNIQHDYYGKIALLERTAVLSRFFLESGNIKDLSTKKIVANTEHFFKYRLKLIKEKKLRYWFKLWRFRKEYPSFRQYLGDLYYFFQR